MRLAAASIVILSFISQAASAEPLAIDQRAWLNYAVIVAATGKQSDVQLSQRGDINGISSVQMSGEKDAILATRQSGKRNTAVTYQSGWMTVLQAAQEGPHGPGGYTNLPTRYISGQTDEGYLSYFMTGGFSLVTLTDQNHTWFSRFGRAR